MADYASDLLGGRQEKAAETPVRDYASDFFSPTVKRVASRTVETTGAPYHGGASQAAVDVAQELPRQAWGAVKGFWQGVTDIPIGLAQLAVKFGPDNVDQAVDEYVKTREKEFEEGGGSEIARATGTIVASMPVGGKTAAVTLPGRMKQGAKVGTALGAATPVTGDTENFGLSKALQVGGGAVTGALSVPVAEFAIRAVGSAVNTVANMLRGAPARLTNKATQDAVENTLTVELQKQGVNWTDLSKQARDAMVLETQKALKAGGTIDDEAIRRIADFQKLDMEGTAGQISRDPGQFALERNLGKTETGAPLAERFGAQNERLISSVDKARGATGSTTADAFTAGQSGMGGLRAADDAERRAVGDLYKAARDNLGRASPVDAAEFSRQANLALDEGMLGHYLPAEVRNILNDVTGGKVPLNVDTMVKIDQVLSGAQRAAGQGTPQSLAIGKVRDALNAAPIESSAGEGAKAAFDTARAAAKTRFEKIESIPALSDMLQNKTIAPEDFVESYVIRGSVNEVKKLMGELPPGARRDVRAAVVDWLKTKGVSGSGDAATFPQAGYNRALDTIGKRNLESIFEGEPQILEQLRRVGRVAANVQKAPVSSGVNYSSSATTLMDMLDRVARLPVVGAALPKGGDVVRATQVTRSLSPMAPVREAPPFLTMEALDEAARGSVRIAPGAGAEFLLSQ